MPLFDVKIRLANFSSSSDCCVNRKLISVCIKWSPSIRGAFKNKPSLATLSVRVLKDNGSLEYSELEYSELP